MSRLEKLHNLVYPHFRLHFANKSRWFTHLRVLLSDHLSRRDSRHHKGRRYRGRRNSVHHKRGSEQGSSAQRH